MGSNTRKETVPGRHRGEGDYEAAARYQKRATDHARSGRSQPAAEAARGDREARPEYLDEAEQAGKARMAEEDPLLYRPRWWTKNYDSLWERAKAALARDWEQTRQRYGRDAGADLDQSALDTIAQIAGNSVPAGSQPAAKPEHWQAAEPMARLGYGAGLEANRDWDDRAEAEMKREWEKSGAKLDWKRARECARLGWSASRGAFPLSSPRAVPPEDLHQNQ